MMRTEAEIRLALEVMTKAESDAVGSSSELIVAIFLGTLRFVLNDGDSPWPKWLDDLERAQRQ